MFAATTRALRMRRIYLGLLAAVVLPASLVFAQGAQASITLAPTSIVPPNAMSLGVSSTNNTENVTLGNDVAVVLSKLDFGPYTSYLCSVVGSVDSLGPALLPVQSHLTVLSGPDEGLIATGTPSCGFSGTGMSKHAVLFEAFAFPGSGPGQDTERVTFTSLNLLGFPLSLAAVSNRVYTNWDNPLDTNSWCSTGFDLISVGAIRDTGLLVKGSNCLLSQTSIPTGQSLNASPGLGTLFFETPDESPVQSSSSNDFSTHVNWGDESSNWPGLAATYSGFTVNGALSHSWSSAGLKCVFVTVKDIDTPTNKLSFDYGAYVWSLAGNTTLGPITLPDTLGTAMAPVTLGTVTDPNPYSKITDYSARTQFGDGSSWTPDSLTAGTGGLSVGGLNVLGSHVYMHPGTYNALTQVFGPNGYKTFTSTIKVNPLVP